MQTLKCHSKSVTDFAFLSGSSTLFATAGANDEQHIDQSRSARGAAGGLAYDVSSHNYNVAVWDALQHPRRSRVFGVRLTDEDHVLVGAGSTGGQSQGQPAGSLTAAAVALRHSEARSMLLVGTRKGQLSVLDLRAMTGDPFSSSVSTSATAFTSSSNSFAAGARGAIVQSFLAHSQSARTLAIDPLARFCVSGSQSGEVKIWSLPLFYLLVQITLRQGADVNAVSILTAAECGLVSPTNQSSGNSVVALYRRQHGAHPMGAGNVAHQPNPTSVTQLTIPQNEPDVLYVSCADGTIRIFYLPPLLPSIFNCNI